MSRRQLRPDDGRAILQASENKECIIEIIFLIGLPGSGKTTFRKEFCAANPDHIVISTDDVLEGSAHASGKTYNEIWQTEYTAAAQKAFTVLQHAIEVRGNIIVDRTNLVRLNQVISRDPTFFDFARQEIYDLLPSDYRRIAILFIQDPEIIEQRRIARNETGKQISAEAIERMRDSFQPPSADEFDMISIPKTFYQDRAAAKIQGLHEKIGQQHWDYLLDVLRP